MCHVSRVTCHVSRVMCQKINKLPSEKIGQSGGASRWRVCYQRGLPRLVWPDNSIGQRLKAGSKGRPFVLCPSVVIRLPP